MISRGHTKFLLHELSGRLIFLSTIVLDAVWLHGADTLLLLLYLSVLPSVRRSIIKYFGYFLTPE